MDFQKTKSKSWTRLKAATTHQHSTNFMRNFLIMKPRSSPLNLLSRTQSQPMLQPTATGLSKSSQVVTRTGSKRHVLPLTIVLPGLTSANVKSASHKAIAPVVVHSLLSKLSRHHRLLGSHELILWKQHNHPILDSSTLAQPTI